jgi:hypothetical protein
MIWLSNVLYFSFFRLKGLYHLSQDDHVLLLQQLPQGGSGLKKYNRRLLSSMFPDAKKTKFPC